MASMQMNQQVLQSLQSSTQVMQAVNADMNPGQMMQTMKAFAMEMEKAGIQSEMMGDAFEMMEDPSATADADDVYNGILGEIGLEYSGGQAAVASNSLAQPVAAAATEEVKQEEDGLEARLAALRMWDTHSPSKLKWVIGSSLQLVLLKYRLLRLSPDL